MEQGLLSAISNTIARHRGAVRRERDALTASIAVADRERSELESQAAETPGEAPLLNRLHALIGRLDRDRWRREWLEEQITMLDRMEEELQAEVHRAEIDLATGRLQEVRERMTRVQEEIPVLENQLSRLREEVPRLEAVIVSLTEKLSGLRRRDTSGPGR